MAFLSGGEHYRARPRTTARAPPCSAPSIVESTTRTHSVPTYICTRIITATAPERARRRRTYAQVRDEGQDHDDSQEEREEAERGRLLQPRGRGKGAGLCRARHGPGRWQERPGDARSRLTDLTCGAAFAVEASAGVTRRSTPAIASYVVVHTAPCCTRASVSTAGCWLVFSTTVFTSSAVYDFCFISPAFVVSVVLIVCAATVLKM